MYVFCSNMRRPSQTVFFLYKTNPSCKNRQTPSADIVNFIIRLVICIVGRVAPPPPAIETNSTILLDRVLLLHVDCARSSPTTTFDFCYCVSYRNTEYDTTLTDRVDGTNDQEPTH